MKLRQIGCWTFAVWLNEVWLNPTSCKALAIHCFFYKKSCNPIIIKIIVQTISSIKSLPLVSPICICSPYLLTAIQLLLYNTSSLQTRTSWGYIVR